MFVISYNNYFFKDNALGKRSIFNILLFGILLIFLMKNMFNKDKRKAYIFSFLFSFSLVVGKVIYDYNNIDMFFKQNFIINIISLISFTKIFGELFHLVFVKIISYKKKNNIYNFFTKKYTFFFIWLFIFLFWLPAFLAYYPGILSYDSDWQTNLVYLGLSHFDNLNPVLHTFIWYLCVNIGRIISVEPLAFYSIIQMIFFSFVLAKVLKLMIDKKSDNWIIIISILFFALNPSIAIFSMSMTKDIFFTGFFVLLILEIYKLEDNKSEYLKSIKKWITLFLITLFMFLFRNNGIFIGISVFILYLIKNKKVLLPILTAIGLYFMIIFILFSKLGISSGTITEGLSISMQQIAFTVYEKHNEMDSETLDSINSFIPYEVIMEKYNPRLADPIKGNFKTKETNIFDYFNWYFKLLFKYPKEYLSAFLSTNLSYWYIDGDSDCGVQDKLYIETQNYPNDYYNVQRNSKFPKLLDFYEDFASYKIIENTPILNFLFSITMPLWITLFAFFVLLYKKSNKTLVILSILSLWLNYMFGPISNFRYIFPIMVLYPLLVFLMYGDNNKK